MPGTRQKTVKKARKLWQPKKAAATKAVPKKAPAKAGRGGDHAAPIAIAVAVNHAAPPWRRAPRRLAAAPPAPEPFARGYNMIQQPAPVVNLTPAPEPVKAPAPEPVKRPEAEPHAPGAARPGGNDDHRGHSSG